MIRITPEQENLKENLALWFYFTIQITLCSAAVLYTIGLLIFYYLKNHSSLFDEGPSILVSACLLLSTGLFASIMLTLWISHRFFKPIDDLCSAIAKVATGDFTVSLPEKASGNRISRVNRNFNTMVRELRSTETLQTDFVQNVSHEFKTPLATIEGYASLLSGADLNEENALYVRRILEGTRELSSLTGNILALSRLQNHQVSLQKEWFSLDEQLRRVTLNMEPLWGKKNLDIDIDLTECTLFANKDLICQVWINLLSNAIKFTPAGGVISLRILDAPGEIGVSVRDNGIGMSDEVKEHIFNRFYQGENSRRTNGNGLGLSLVKQILILCEGRIDVESAPDCGSCFTVWLPKQ